MNNKKIDSKNIIYAVIGILTLVVAVVGATFAYYTATKANNVITGNMATVNFNMYVDKKTSADNSRGLIPMSNIMVEKAVSNASTKGICVDDNGNAVCQIYKITVNNGGTASMFVDGYVTLTGGSGVSTDYSSATTTMRWAQVFCTENSNNLSTCTTQGSSTARQTQTTGFSWGKLGDGVTNNPHNTTQILDTLANTTASGTIQGNNYPIINKNYIRVSKHTTENYTQSGDVTSALVYNQYLQPNDNNSGNNTGTSASTFTDSQVYYIVVWLSETGTNQTAGSGGTNVPDDTANFFTGTVKFISSQGGEITSRFSGWNAVTPDTKS